MTSGVGASGGAERWGGVPLDRVLPALRQAEPGARACWVYDLDALARRADRMRAAFEPAAAHVAYALKANPLPALLDTIRDAGLAAEAGSLGELQQAARVGFAPATLVLNGNGRTAEEAAWAARAGVHSINADSIEELDLLQHHAAAEGRTLRVALRVNPDIDAPVHRYIATGHDAAKFGVAPHAALEAWVARARWPQLRLDGVHVHVGSNLLDPAPLEQCADFALELAAEAARRGAALGLVNLGGGFGVDYSGSVEFPLERYAASIAARARASALDWVVEPGRWLVASPGVLLAEVLWVKRRGTRRFVVLAAGLNDLLRPALYGARHTIVPLVPRPGTVESATVVGPVCESSDCFDDAAPLPPIERGDVVAIRDAGAYGSAMSSNYNGRGRLAELVARGGSLIRVRAGETAADLEARDRVGRLELAP